MSKCGITVRKKTFTAICNEPIMTQIIFPVNEGAWSLSYNIRIPDQVGVPVPDCLYCY